MIFYRVENATPWFSMEFQPYVPHYRLPDEDSTIPRICIADSIEGCILSAACTYGGDYIGNYEVFRVFEFDIDVHDENLKFYDEIKNYVPDSMETGECWYLNSLCAERCFYITHISKNDRNVYFDLISEDDLGSKILSVFDFDINQNFIDSVASLMYDFFDINDNTEFSIDENSKLITFQCPNLFNKKDFLEELLLMQ